MPSNKQLLLQYAGFGMQLIVMLGIATYAGHWLDRKMNIGFPLLVWLLPLLVLIYMIARAIKDTNKK